MIVWLASYPRSGNTLVRMLLHDCFDVETTYSVHPDTDPGDPNDDAWAALIGHVYVPKQELNRMMWDTGLYFVKTHMCVVATLPVPAIYIVRNGRDALISHAHYRIDKRNVKTTFEDELHGLVWENRKGGGGWSHHVECWTNRASPTVVLRYEDLLQHPVMRLRFALLALGIHLHETGEQLPSFDELHERWPQFFRVGATEQWRDEMQPETRRLFWKHHKDAMRLMGYT